MKSRKPRFPTTFLLMQGFKGAQPLCLYPLGKEYFLMKGEEKEYV
jgi:hypothetical protein